MDDTEKAISDPSIAKVKLKLDNVEICYPAIFQSGGEFDLRSSPINNNEDPLYYDVLGVIICAIGFGYKSYYENVARTHLIDANAVQSKAYKALQKAPQSGFSLCINLKELCCS